MRAFEPPPDEEGAVEHVSASVVLAAVEESGPNYLLPKAPEPVKSRLEAAHGGRGSKAGGSGDPRDGHAGRDLRGGGEVVAGDHHGADGGHRRPARAPRPVHQLRGHVLDDEQWRRVAEGTRGQS